MVEQGWSVARFWSHEVLAGRKDVLETIVAILDGKMLEPVEASDLRFVPRCADKQVDE